MSDIGEVIEMKLAAEGVASVAVSDGHVWVFTEKVLLGLLEVARGNADGRVVVFVQNPVLS